MPPSASEFHRIERETLAPALRRSGFTRPQGVGLGGWVRPEGDAWLVVWTQLSQRNRGDDPAGHSFTLEMQLGPAPVAGLGAPRRRIYGLLTEAERLEHRRIHDGVSVEAAATPFPLDSDPWFAYTDEADVRRWLEFLARVLPGAIERFLAQATAGVSGRGA